MAGETGQGSSSGADAFFGKQSDQLDDWLRIEPNGDVTAFSGKVEVGTGTRTALSQIVAEELDVPFERVHLVMGDTARTPDEGYTAGSMTMERGGSNLRNAAAEARRAILEVASDALDAALDELTIHEGIVAVRNHPDRTISIAQLMGGKKFNRRVTGQAPRKSPKDYRVVGTAVRRVDLFPKFTGQPSFIQDLRIPGMLHGRVVRPPHVGAQLVSLDEKSIAHVPGIVKRFRQGNFVGIVAEREEQAVRAANELKVEWRTTVTLPRMDDLYNVLRAAPTEDDELVKQGHIQAAFKRAAQELHATYCVPYQAHASIGPSCAIADVKEDRVTVWGTMPGPFALRGALAQLLQRPPEQVHLIYVEGAGAYGQNGSDDVCADAVILSRAVGRPVRVQWSRQDEFVWEPKSAAMVIEVHGALDKKGHIIAWEYDVWSPTHAARPRFAPQLLAFQLLNAQPPPPTRYFYGAERNAPTNYSFQNQRVTVHWQPNSPLRTSSFRSLGGTGNTFANESFMDEMAAAARVDAVEFRLRYLDDPRARAVLQAAAEAAKWDAHPSPRVNQNGIAQGRGVAFVQYENEEAIVACVAHVEVDTASGAMRVPRIVVAQDCGLIINPDGVKNQIEGNVIQSLSRALKEQVHFDQSQVTSVDWDTYPILTFSEIPDIEVVLLNRPAMESKGVGEPASTTTAAAVANAIFDATGARLRQMPFTPERVRAALAQVA